MGRNPNEGYTLFELLIVVIIIGLLVSIAIPVFNRERAVAKNGAATATLTNAYRSAYQEYSSNQQWPSTATQLAGMLNQDEKAYTFKPFVYGSSETTGVRDITVTVEDSDMVTFCNQSSTGLYYCLRTDSTAGLPAQLASIDTDGLPGPLAVFDPPTANAGAYSSDSNMVARSTGTTEKEARDALPTRGHAAAASSNAATYWASCVGSCASGGGGGSTTTTTPMTYAATRTGIGSQATCPFDENVPFIGNNTTTFTCTGGISGTVRNPYPPVAQSTTGAISSLSPNTAISFTGGNFSLSGSNTGQLAAAGNNKANKPFSVEIWVKPTSVSGTQGIIGLDNEWAILLQGNEARFAVQQNTPWSVQQITSTGAAIQANQWTQIIGTWDSGVLRVYVNGQKRGEKTGILALNDNQGGNFTIGYIGAGGWAGNGSLIGAMDEFSFYAKQLTDAQVASLYSATQ